MMFQVKRRKHKMNKKAEISINMIIMAILGLIVLVVLLMVFNDQIRGAAKNYFNIGNDAMNSAKGDKCLSLGPEIRKCDTTCDIKAGWIEVSAKCEDNKLKCCQKD